MNAISKRFRISTCGWRQDWSSNWQTKWQPPTSQLVRIVMRALVGSAVTAIAITPVGSTESIDPLLGAPGVQPVARLDSSTRAFHARELQAREALGAKLFMDPRLSADGTISCSSCHIPEQAFSDGHAVGIGLHGAAGIRNTPSLINVRAANSLFWDGRRESLESQAADPLVHPSEHGLQSEQDLVRILRQDVAYEAGFKQAFPGTIQAVSAVHAYTALAAFERSLVLGNSGFDRFLYSHDSNAISEAARRGYALFTGRAQCSNCHLIGAQSAALTDERFHPLGIGLQPASEQLPDLLKLVAQTNQPAGELLISHPDLAILGRYLVTRDARDVGAFRTPSLRNVALTAPYMHDGSVATLAEAVDREVYYRGSESGHVLVLTPGERADLVAFLESLTSTDMAALAFRSRQLAASVGLTAIREMDK